MPYTERKAASLASFSMHLSSLGLVNLKMLPQKYSRSRKDLLLLSTQPQLITTTTDKVRYLVLFVLRSSFKNLLKKQKKIENPHKTHRVWSDRINLTLPQLHTVSRLCAHDSTTTTTIFAHPLLSVSVLYSSFAAHTDCILSSSKTTRFKVR